MSSSFRVHALLGAIVVASFAAANQPALAALSYYDTVMSHNPIGYWRLGETSGSTAFNEVAGNDGTYSGAGQGSTGALYPADTNTAASFDGSGANVQVVTYPAMQFDWGSNFSVEAWFQASSAGQPFQLAGIVAAFDDPSGGYGGWLIGIHTFGGDRHRVYAELRSPDGVLYRVTDDSENSGVTFTDDIWHHVVMTHDVSADGSGKTLASFKLYIDGNLASTEGAGGFFGEMAGSISVPIYDMAIGQAAGLGYPLNGLVDEVALYGEALTSQQVLAHYNARFNPTGGEIPEPASLALFGIGLFGAIAILRRVRK